MMTGLVCTAGTAGSNFTAGLAAAGAEADAAISRCARSGSCCQDPELYAWLPSAGGCCARGRGLATMNVVCCGRASDAAGFGAVVTAALADGVDNRRRKARAELGLLDSTSTRALATRTTAALLN